MTTLEAKRMRLLLTNDDGFDAPGLRTLEAVAQELGQVVIVAPRRAHSGCSHLVTTDAAIRGMFGAQVVDADQLRTPTGWTLQSTVDGYPTYQRTRTITADSDSLVNSTLTIALKLGDLPVRGEALPMLVRDGSRLELAGPKGALGATYPMTNGTTCCCTTTVDRRRSPLRHGPETYAALKRVSVAVSVLT